MSVKRPGGARLYPGAALFVLGALALTLAGCGGSGSEGTTDARADARTGCPHATGIGAEIALPNDLLVKEWRLESRNVEDARGCVLLEGEPVAGALVKVDGYTIPTPTDARGSFVYAADTTLPRRHTVSVADVANATIAGSELSAEERSKLLGEAAGLAVSFKLRDLEARRTDAGIVVTGSASYANAEETPPPPVVLFSYQLSGTVRGPDGEPVQGAVVSTRSVDREFWTLSPESGPDGTYTSFFYPTGETDPVGFTVRVAVDDDVFEFLPDELVFFQKLRSARLDIDLPPEGFPLAIPKSIPYRGAVYEGLLVGVAVEGLPIKPVAARWADENGRFELTLPASAAGKEATFWESSLYAFSQTDARPGEPADIDLYPTELGPDVPQDLAKLRLPR